MNPINKSSKIKIVTEMAEYSQVNFMGLQKRFLFSLDDVTVYGFCVIFSFPQTHVGVKFKIFSVHLERRTFHLWFFITQPGMFYSFV